MCAEIKAGHCGEMFRVAMRQGKKLALPPTSVALAFPSGDTHGRWGITGRGL